MNTSSDNLEPVIEKEIPEIDVSKALKAAFPASNEDGGQSENEKAPPVVDLPPIEDATKLLTDEIPEPVELIKGVLHQSSKLVIGGGSKTFKTWCLVDMGISVAAGVSWWGFETTKGKVLYINFEIQKFFIRKRIQEVASAKNVQLLPGQLDVWNLRGFSADLSELVPIMLERLGTGIYALVIIDPIYKGMGKRDENRAGDIADLLNQVERLAVQSGAAVAFGAHFSKGNQAGKESIDRIGGSGVFARDPDSILTLTRHKVEDAFTADFTLRNFPPLDSFVLRRFHPLMSRADDLDPKHLKDGRPPLHTPEDLLALLVKPMRSTKWKKEAAERGISDRSFYRLLKILEQKGQIRKVSGGKEWEKI